MMRKLLVMLSCVFLVAFSVRAQDRTVAGVVTGADGSPQPGVNVVVKGTTQGTITDVQGEYSLSVAEGATLVFSSIGMATQEVLVGSRSVVDVVLQEDVTQLTEVVVTAQGIEREVRSLGFAQTSISANLLAEKPETDIGRSLQGRSPGIQILNSSGVAGSGSKINIRGISTITGDSQPMWVVDGVPINTDASDITSNFNDGYTGPSRFLDIDPNNIASVTILRGLQATTTYGSQGRNGVILITTKTGSGRLRSGSKFEGSVTQSYFAVEAIVPEYQNKWGNGFDGAYGEYFSNWGSLLGEEVVGGAKHPYYEYRNMFPDVEEFKLDGKENGSYVPTAAPNNVSDFFQRGYSSTTSLSLRAKTAFGGVSFSYSHLDEEGFIKFNTLQRDNFSLGAQAELVKGLSFSGTFNFVRTETIQPPNGVGRGSNTQGGPSIWANLFYVPRNIDLTNWPWENPLDKSIVTYRNTDDIPNPYWILHNSGFSDLTNRFFSSSSLKYNVMDGVDVIYRLGYDTYSTQQRMWLNRGGGSGITYSGGNPDLRASAAAGGGMLRTSGGLNVVLDHSMLVSINKTLTPEVSLSALLGYNLRRNTYRQTGLESTTQVLHGLLEHRNYASTLPRDYRGTNLTFRERQTIQGIFADINMGYKEMLFLGLAARNDWSSNLATENQSQFYPGASLSFIPTEAVPSMTDYVDFLKLRVAYGSSANFGSRYRVSPVLDLNAQRRVDAQGSVIAMQAPRRLANPNLKPELLVETEFGLEADFLKRRVRLSATYYNRSAKNQIIGRILDYTTGYEETDINAGKVENKGIEAALTVVPISTENLTWEITANFTRNRSLVVSLPEGSKEVVINGYTNIGNFAIEGQPINIMKGTFLPRTPTGDMIIKAEGDYDVSDTIGVIGDPNPDWLGTLITSLTYKGFSLGMQWDYVYGGDMFSYTAAAMIGRGVVKDLENFDPTLPMILPGKYVPKEGGKYNYEQAVDNTQVLTTSSVFFYNNIIGGSPNDRGIYDATRIRFREVSLSYALPKQLVSKAKLSGVTITAIGNNLWFRAINTPKYAKADFDRSSFGTNNGAGFDYLGGPSARRYGVSLKINF